MKNGFTLIEMMIVVAVLAIVGRVGYLAFDNNSQWSLGAGWTRKTCINGMLFVQNHRAITQILGADGKGIGCKDAK